jgi:hypothetical protein
MTALLPYAPLLPYAGLALVIALSLTLFLSVKRESWRVEKRLSTRIAALEERHAALAEQAAGLHQHLVELQQQSEVNAAASPHVAVNLQKRSQAIRMFRRGETVEHVAAALSIPQSEVALLLKIYQMTSN